MYIQLYKMSSLFYIKFVNSIIHMSDFTGLDSNKEVYLETIEYRSDKTGHVGKTLLSVICGLLNHNKLDVRPCYQGQTLFLIYSDCDG